MQGKRQGGALDGLAAPTEDCDRPNTLLGGSISRATAATVTSNPWSVDQWGTPV
jgi:hypothetical protein